MPNRRSRAFTIRELAQLAGVSPRTVRRDIAAGRLPVVRVNSRVLRIRPRDAQRYRMRRHHRFGHGALVTPAELATATGLSRRSIWYWIQSGFLSIARRQNARRVFLSKAEVRRKIPDVRFSPTTPVKGAMFVQHLRGKWGTLQRAAEREGIRVTESPWLTVRQVAAITKVSRRVLYHDIASGAVQRVFRYSERRILISVDEAAEYLK